MLIQLLIDQPAALGAVLNRTPVWVWGLLAALVLLGLSQAGARQRQRGHRRGQGCPPSAALRCSQGDFR